MEDLVKKAEDFVINKLSEPNKYDPSKKEIKITTSQIRKFLSGVNLLQNKMNEEGEILSDETVNEIKYLKIKLAYQAGREKTRENKIKVLYDNLVPEIDNIGNSKKKFIEFSKYIEAIVAYHKFYGGENDKRN